MTHPIDDDPMTVNRRAAIANATNAQQNINRIFEEMPEQVDTTVIVVMSSVIAECAQVFATLDLADATREQTAALEAIDEGRRLGR